MKLGPNVIDIPFAIDIQLHKLINFKAFSKELTISRAFRLDDFDNHLFFT